MSGDTELAAILSNAYAERSFSDAVRAVAVKRLERLNSRINQGVYVPAINFAREYLELGKKRQALRWLKQACEERNVYVLMIASDPLYDTLRSDPQFLKLLWRMKLDRSLD